MPKVSIIVPCYKVEPYIEKCLDSLTKQTLSDIEIIVVNDGSPDNCQEIIDKFALKFPKLIKSCIKENGGISDARNYGLKYATGEYIGFVDSDDYVCVDMFEKMYDKAASKDFDVVVCNVNYICGKKTKCIPSLVDDDIFDNDLIKRQMIDIYPTVWNKIYKKSLFDNDVRFKNDVWYEDVDFLYRMFPYIKSIGVIKEPLINYVSREKSITKTFDKRLYNYIDNWNGIVDFYKENGFYNKYYDEIEYCYCRYLLATFVKGAIKFPKNEFKTAVNIAIDNVKEKFPNYKKNKYLKCSSKGKYIKFFNIFFANLLYFMYNRY